MISFFRSLFCWLLLAAVARAADLPALWAERVKAVVAVEYYTETETERRPSISYGTVIDRDGTIILPSVAVSPRATPSQLKDFKIYLPGSAEGATTSDSTGRGGAAASSSFLQPASASAAITAMASGTDILIGRLLRGR